MTTGFFAFMSCAICVWLLLGLINPHLALPPLVMRWLEPADYEPRRKMVFQWASMFLIALFVVSVIAGMFASDEMSSMTNDELVVEQLALKNIIAEENISARSGKTECVDISFTHIKTIKSISAQINAVALMRSDAEAKTIVAEVHNKIATLHHQLLTAGCI